MKQRHLKTLYDRFSHHKVENLKELEKDISSRLIDFFTREDQQYRRHNIEPISDVFQAMLKLNIPYSGKFFLSNSQTDNCYFGEVEAFRLIWEKPLSDVNLKDKDGKFLEVQVIASDFKDAVLVIYKDRSTFDNKPFNTQIIRDKFSDILLEGNIGHII
jgi:hypothetical protein